MGKMKLFCFKHNKEIEGTVNCSDYYFHGTQYHGMGIHQNCLTCKYKFIYTSIKELADEKVKRGVL
jgi:hypothetical protein